jgi:hypothetical protein
VETIEAWDIFLSDFGPVGIGRFRRGPEGARKVGSRVCGSDSEGVLVVLATLVGRS